MKFSRYDPNAKSGNRNFDLFVRIFGDWINCRFRRKDKMVLDLPFIILNSTF